MWSSWWQGWGSRGHILPSTGPCLRHRESREVADTQVAISEVSAPCFSRPHCTPGTKATFVKQNEEETQSSRPTCPGPYCLLALGQKQPQSPASSSRPPAGWVLSPPSFPEGDTEALSSRTPCSSSSAPKNPDSICQGGIRQLHGPGQGNCTLF